MSRRLMTKADRLAARYRPPTYTAVLESDAAAVYVGDGQRRDRPCYSAIGYRGSAGRPTFHYVFSTPQARDTYVSTFLAGIERAAADRAVRAAQKSAWINPLKVGDILYSSWGYDQTNVDFYIVQHVSGRAVIIAGIDGDETPDGGHMSGRVVPAQPIRVTGEPMRKIAQPRQSMNDGDRGVSISMTSYSSAHIWDGQPKYCSHYA